MPGTLIEMLAERVARNPQAEAFSFGEKSFSWGRLGQGIEACASKLVQLGVSPCDRVVLALPNGPDFFTWFYGVQRAGGIAVPTFPGSGPRRLEALAERCDARLIIVEETPTGAAALGNDESRPLRVSAGSLAVDSSSQPPLLADPGLRPDDIAYIQFTSGTTGDPKGVQLSHANVLQNIDQLIAGFEITPDDVFVSWLPAYHDMGLVLMTMVPFSLGARLVLLPASLRSIKPWLKAIEGHHGTITASPDFGYRAALRLAVNVQPQQPREPVGTQPTHERELPDLSSLRVALNAAEPVRASTIEAFEDAFGLESVVIAGYGLAEATVGVSSWTPGRPPKVDPSGSVSVGKPFPEVEVAILGEDGLLGPNEPGEILVKSPANTRGYWNPVSRILSGAEIQQVGAEGPDGSRAAGNRAPRGMLSGGKVQGIEAETSSGGDEASGLFWSHYVRTGDLGYLDDEGDLFVSGRLKQMIIQAGRNIAPREVEEIVDTLPFVRRSAAVGVDRGDDPGEQLYVFAEMQGHARPDDETCREHVVAVVDAIHSHLGLRPGRVYLVASRSVPFTANGKVRYGELKEAYSSGQLRDGGRLWYPDW